MTDISQNLSLGIMFWGEGPYCYDEGQGTEYPMTGQESHNTKLNELVDCIKRLPQQKKLSSCEESIKLLENLLKEIKQELLLNSPKHLPNTNDDYPRYPGRTNAIEWLEKYWGKYLKYFGSEENFLFQDQLGKLDPNLLLALKNQISRENRNEGSNVKLSNIVPPKKERITREIKNLSQEEIRAFYRMGSAVRQGFRSGILPKNTPNLG